MFGAGAISRVIWSGSIKAAVTMPMNVSNAGNVEQYRLASRNDRCQSGHACRAEEQRDEDRQHRIKRQQVAQRCRCNQGAAKRSGEDLRESEIPTRGRGFVPG